VKSDREKAISYIEEGHALLRKYGLYGNSDEVHLFAVDRALANFTERGGFDRAAEAAAALQALYEAKRLVTARSSIEGRRIILGDWFISLAVRLALPLKKAGLADLVSEELCRIGADANKPSLRVSKKSFCTTIDRFTEKLLTDTDEGDSEPLCPPALPIEPDQSHISLLFPASGNLLLAAIGAGYFKFAAAETRSALSRMELWFRSRYAGENANEMDGWIYGAISSGGKRMRPMLVRLCAGLGADDNAYGQGIDLPAVINIMSTIELMHSASLVHDDIVDRSPMRRSRATINAEKGDGYAAMCGFRMIADALRLIGAGTSDRLVETLAAFPMQMCGGELQQLDLENKPELQSEDEYYRRIACKTAALIEGSCVCGAMAGGADEQTIRALAGYGHALGLLFQMRDDLLDYGIPETSGKPVSQDMERGLYSLPLLYARETLSESDPDEYEILDSALRKHIKAPADLRYLKHIAESSGGIDHTRKAIEKQAESAFSSLALLPRGPWTEALASIVSALTDTYEILTDVRESNAIEVNHDGQRNA